MFILDADESGKALAPAEDKEVSPVTHLDPKWFDVSQMTINYAFTSPPVAEKEFPNMMYNVCASPTQEIIGYSDVTYNTDTYKSNYELQNRSSIPLAGIAKPFVKNKQ
jgi:hypothetical protein